MYTDTRKSRRKVDDTGRPAVVPHAKHEWFPGQWRHPDETYRYGSIMSRKSDQPAIRGTVRPNPNGARFTPSAAFHKADHTKGVQM